MPGTDGGRPGRDEASTTIDDAAGQFLLVLLDTPAPSGFEAAAADVWATRARELGLDVRTDRIGNTYATANAGASRRLAFVGHLDEIGLIVTKVDDKGFLRFATIGGWDASVLVGQRVRVLASVEGAVVPGTVGRPPIHAQDAAAREKAPKVKDLWIDVGAPDGDAARQLVRVGDPAVLDASPQRLHGGERLVSRSADDRIGAFVALEAAAACVGLGVEVVAVGSIGEEIGGAGAAAAAYDLRPEAAVAIDVTTPSDVPSPGEGLGDLGLGRGPIITRGATTTRRIVDALVDTAEAEGVPYQLRGLGIRTSTDADQIVRAGAGVAVGLVSVPARYLHTPCEQVDLGDVAASIRLLATWAKRTAEAG